jgi:trigger factor
MLQKVINKLPKSQVDVTITLPWADFQNKWTETLTKLAQDVELPGFRKGTAPINMVEAQLGRKLEDEAFRVIMPEALIQALQGTDIVPIDYPNYQIMSFQKGVELKFNARLTNRPEIKVGDYKAVKVAKPAAKQVTDQDVDTVIADLFNRWRLRQPNTGTANQAASESANQQNNNAPQSGPMGNSGSLSFGSNNAATDSPTNQSANPLPQTPDVPNDEFAKAVGSTSIADLRSQIKTDLESQANYDNELDYEEAILQEIEKITSVDLPDVLVQDELNRMLLSLQRNVTERGLLLEEYLKSQQKTVDSIKNEWKPQAEKNVRMELGLSEVARLEGVSISDDELQVEIDKIQDQRVKQQFSQQEPKMQLRHALRQTKTLTTLKSLVGAS